MLDVETELKYILVKTDRLQKPLLIVSCMNIQSSGGKACNKTMLYIDAKTWKLTYYLVLNLAQLKARRWLGIRQL